MLDDLIKRSNTAAFRGALWITLIALVTTGVALTVQYLQTTRLIAARVRVLLDDEVLNLAERYEAGGIVELGAFLQRQRQLPRLNHYFYVLADGDGRVLMGDLATWPAPVTQTGHAHFRMTVVGVSQRPETNWVDTATVSLDGRYRLLVGRVMEDRIQAHQQYLMAMFWSLLVTGIMGLVLGWWFSRRGLAFLDRVSASGKRFLRGHLEERIPVSPRCDEYDRLAETVNACFDEIEHVVRSLRAATDGLAHDLKTPLTRIRARLELAQMREAGHEELLEVVAESRQDLDALLRIIDDVLSLARAEATNAESFTDVNLTEIVEEVLELYEPVAAARNIRFETRLDAASTMGARSLIGQLAANLIDNAIKYSPDGEAIAVSVTSSPQGVQLCVADRGPGIPPGRREDVLSRFVRLDESRNKEGVGIGLSIVSAVVRVHRAKLQLMDNEPGLKALVLFPVPPDEPRAEKQT
jgi:signal transduction histidine kinase